MRKIHQVKRLVGSRDIDAVILNVGADDIGFGSVLSGCITHDDCFDQPARWDSASHEIVFDPNAPPHQTLQDVVEQRFDVLSREYGRLPDKLANRLAWFADPSKRGRVHVVEYYDPTHDPNGNFCTINTPIGGLNSEEAQWAYSKVVKPLNAEVHGAAIQNQWDYIGGTYDPPSDTFVGGIQPKNLI